jgi:hypothetical protein
MEQPGREEIISMASRADPVRTVHFVPSRGIATAWYLPMSLGRSATA